MEWLDKLKAMQQRVADAFAVLLEVKNGVWGFVGRHPELQDDVEKTFHALRNALASKDLAGMIQLAIDVKTVYDESIHVAATERDAFAEMLAKLRSLAG